MVQLVKIEISEKNPFAAATNAKEVFLVDDQLSLYTPEERTNEY